MAPQPAPEDRGRRELEEFWDVRVQKAKKYYLDAAGRYWRMTEEPVEGDIPQSDGAFAVAMARKAEIKALAEYWRVLKIYEALVLSGETPPPDDDQTPLF